MCDSIKAAVKWLANLKDSDSDNFMDAFAFEMNRAISEEESTEVLLEENYWMTVYNKLDLIIRFTGDNEWRRKKRKERKGRLVIKYEEKRYEIR